MTVAADLARGEGPALVDTHVHFFDFDDPEAEGLSWQWLDPAVGGLVPDIAPVRARRFGPTDLFAEGHRLASLVKCVHVEAAHGARNPLLETRWLASLRERHGAPHAAVVRVELDRPDAAEMIERHAVYPWVRGVRDLGKTALLQRRLYADGVRRLGSLGLAYEIVCRHTRFRQLAALARQCEETTIVLQHFGLPPHPGTEAFGVWREALVRLGREPNVLLKLSGIGLMSTAWTFADAAALVGASLEAFGVDRCLVGTNWPIDRTGASYPDAVLAIAAACSGLGVGERERLFAGNASSLYAV